MATQSANASSGMQFFTSDDGLRIAYGEWGPLSAAPPVVLHHGFAASAAMNWVGPGIVDALVARGHRVFALDARGHGNSDKPHDPARYGESIMAKDLRKLFDLIGTSEVDLVGYSMGAIVSLITASEDTRIRRLVIGGIGGTVTRLAELGARARAVVTGGLTAASDEEVESAIAQQFRRFATFGGGDVQALAAQATAMHADVIHFDRITAPTLLVAGDRDWIARKPEQLIAALPNARLTMVPGNHLSAVIKPEFRDAVLNFLD